MTTSWVKPRANSRADRAGDPLDGLVNMFDVGIVLAVAFLIAALAAHHLTNALVQKPASVQTTKPKHSIVVTKKQKVVPLQPTGVKVPVRNGKSVGVVYQLPNGQLVYVTNK
jgi:hypothetical protein